MAKCTIRIDLAALGNVPFPVISHSGYSVSDDIGGQLSEMQSLPAPKQTRGPPFQEDPRDSAPGLTKQRKTPRTVAAFRPWRSWRAYAPRDLEHPKYTQLFTCIAERRYNGRSVRQSMRRSAACSRSEQFVKYGRRLLHLGHGPKRYACVIGQRREGSADRNALRPGGLLELRRRVECRPS